MPGLRSMVGGRTDADTWASQWSVAEGIWCVVQLLRSSVVRHIAVCCGVSVVVWVWNKIQRSWYASDERKLRCFYCCGRCDSTRAFHLSVVK